MDAPSSEGPSIPDTVLDLLITISGSRTIEETLEVLTKISRSDDGRSCLASKGLLPTVLDLIRSSGHNHHLLLLSLRLLRNLCAGEPLNQDMFIDHGGVMIVSRAMSKSCTDEGSFWEVVRSGLQVLANASLAGERHRCDIWRCFFPTEFLRIAGERRREICDPLCKVIYICIDGNSELFSELCKDPGLTIMAEVIRTAATAGFGEEWIKLLLSRICVDEETHHLPGLFSKLIISESGGFTLEQAFLLRLVSDITNERIKEINFSNDFALYIFGICRSAAAAVHTVDFTTSRCCQSGLPTGQAAIDLLEYSLAILRDICSVDSLLATKNLKDVVDTLISEGLLDFLLGLLRELEPPSQIRKIMKQEEQPEMSKRRSCPYKGFRRDLISIVGNCAFGRRHVQDEIRERDGILLILQQCVLDEEDNPFLREWGIWSMRNILENNEENMKLVADLEFQGSVDVPEINQAGFKVEVDPQTRRVKLVNIT